MSATSLAQTPLAKWHIRHGARMVDFAGWSMPVQYSSIVEEHQAVRDAAGMFDVSHMGRLQVFGAEAARHLDRLLTRRVLQMRAGEIRYSLLCNAAGGILDDVLVYRLVGDQEAARDDRPAFQLVVNASNRAKIHDHLEEHLRHSPVRISDLTNVTAMIAVQGPQAIPRCREWFDLDPRRLGNYRGSYADMINQACYVSRTGYTGEDGLELIVSANYADAFWESLAEEGITPCGLAARDTLRLEAAMPLYGHELSETIDPFQAGLQFAVNLKDRDFLGRDALLELRNRSDRPVRIGLLLEGRRPARAGASILLGEEPVGQVTSGTFSPTLQRPIAMGYVEPRAAAKGQALAVDIRGKTGQATVVDLPFYQRKKP